MKPNSALKNIFKAAECFTQAAELQENWEIQIHRIFMDNKKEES